MKIYTDGSSLGNPGPGGWAAVYVTEDGRYNVISGSLDVATNNQAELIAVFKTLRELEKKCEHWGIEKPSKLTIYTDSANVIGWLSQGWKRKNKFVIIICNEIEGEVERLGITLEFVKVKAHSKNRFNTMADSHARLEAETASRISLLLNQP
jgi:ribonuclease HI